MKYVNDSTGGDNTWGEMVIGKPLVTSDIGKGYLYEAICIPNTLTDEEIYIVLDTITNVISLIKNFSASKYSSYE